MKLSEYKQAILRFVTEALQEMDFIIAAGVYGSWLHHDNSNDIDIALIIDSKHGVVNPECYYLLKEYRQSISREINQDVDLVPHTEDELDDLCSPLWYPKSNPSLCYLYPLIGNINLKSISVVKQIWQVQDLAAFIIHENRTVCRRQLTRHINGESGRIFVSKMLHGAANALTYYSCRGRAGFVGNPSNVDECLDRLDLYFDLDTSAARNFLLSCKENLNYDRALQMMYWYEHLLGTVLHHQPSTREYSLCCQKLETMPINLPILLTA